MQIAGDQSRHVLPLTSRYPAVRRQPDTRPQGQRHGPFGLAEPDLSPGGERPRGWPLDWMPYHLEASVPGVVVIDDARAESAKRVASAVGEGAMAVMLVHRYLEKL